MSAAVTVTAEVVADDTAPGVPEITPVAAFSARPSRVRHRTPASISAVLSRFPASSSRQAKPCVAPEPETNSATTAPMRERPEEMRKPAKK